MIKAIETSFDGRLFRSRAEARWAVFFKTLGIHYEYEPEGVYLKDGRKYLPDFRISIIRRGQPSALWVEVKPNEWNNDGKLEQLAMSIQPGERATRVPSLEGYLDFINGKADRGIDCWFAADQYPAGYDMEYLFCVCSSCKSVGFENKGNDRHMKCCPDGVRKRHHHSRSDPHFEAINAGLSERFGT